MAEQIPRAGKKQAGKTSGTGAMQPPTQVSQPRSDRSRPTEDGLKPTDQARKDDPSLSPESADRKAAGNE